MQNKTSKIEKTFERLIFLSRWILAPLYGILILIIFLLAIKIAQETFNLTLSFYSDTETVVVLQIMAIVDLMLVENLLLMVLMVGYTNFVSVIEPQSRSSEDWPKWMSDLDYSGLKVQLLGSIIAITSIKLLRLFTELLETHPINEQIFVLAFGFYLMFLIAVFVIVVVNKIKSTIKHSGDSII